MGVWTNADRGSAKLIRESRGDIEALLFFSAAFNRFNSSDRCYG